MEIRKLVGEERAEADLIWLQSFERGTRSVLESLHEYRNRFAYRIERFGLWDSVGLQATFEMVTAPQGLKSRRTSLAAARTRYYDRLGAAIREGDWGA